MEEREREREREREKKDADRHTHAQTSKETQSELNTNSLNSLEIKSYSEGEEIKTAYIKCKVALLTLPHWCIDPDSHPI